MKPIKIIFYFPEKDSKHFNETEIEVIQFNTSETNLKISEYNFKSKNILLEIKHCEINTLLDFKNASDYKIIYLDKDNLQIGGSFALNNHNCFIIQTQSKRILLYFLKPINQ